MNLTRTVGKLDALNRAGQVVTTDQLRSVEYQVRAARDALARGDQDQATTLLDSLIDDGDYRPQRRAVGGRAKLTNL